MGKNGTVSLEPEMSIAADNSSSHGMLAAVIEQNVEKLLTCVHCGLCLPACPTYRELGNENDSPRGRIYLMRGVAEGRLEVGDAFISHIDLCLGCRACESVCPSGVPYGQLLESARVDVAQAKSDRRSAMAFLIRFTLKQLFTRPRLLAVCMAAARWFRDSGLANLFFTGRAIEGRARFALALLLASRSAVGKAKSVATVKPAGSPRGGSAMMRVSLLRGCVMEGLFGEANRATERVLARNGCLVIDAAGQMCCGALHAHSGEIDVARRLARKNIEAFLASGCERIIVNAAGCGAAMKEYETLLADDPEFRERARDFSSRVRDISEFLAERGIEQPRGILERHVAYDAPCHLLHAQRVSLAPVDLLKAIPGIVMVPLSGHESCCAGAGIYNLQHPDLSAKILEDKIRAIRKSGADIVATGNPGCIMQIGAGAMMAGLEVDVLHPIELLDASYANEQGS
jgi:glycolate oxidase iron-sulfur subunit